MSRGCGVVGLVILSIPLAVIQMRHVLGVGILSIISGESLSSRGLLRAVCYQNSYSVFFKQAHLLLTLACSVLCCMVDVSRVQACKGYREKDTEV